MYIIHKDNDLEYCIGNVLRASLIWIWNMGKIKVDQYGVSWFLDHIGFDVKDKGWVQW